ncbi:MAG TPA: SpvB/TcaC N-terminal domain-containing protein, partial [Aggregicoccus sp.]|nr:SpvB/TcaC N-terminal domain-containing protein [Aggregicoccus sp.]
SYARAILALTSLTLASCQQGSDESAPTLLRLNPAAVQAGADARAEALFDRDTTTGLELERPLTLTLSYAQDVQPQRLKVFAQGRVRAELSGTPPFEVLGEGAWESLTATGQPAARGSVTLTLTPLGGKVRVEELELWGPGLVRPFSSTQLLAERSRETGNLGLANVLVFSAQPTSVTLSPCGLAGGETCASFQLPAPVPLGTVRRAHVVYEAQGLQRPTVLRRSLNGRPAQGGFWLGAGATQHTLADEVNPAWLARTNSVTLCLPDAATDKVAISGVRVLLEQDDGSQPFERELALKLGAALDGDARTSASFAAGSLELGFSRPLSVDAARVDMDVEGMEVQTSLLQGSEWQTLGALSLARGRNALMLDGRTGSGVRLSFGAGRRPDVPAASVAELLVTGSGVGPRLAAPRLVLTSPALQPLGERLSAEHASGRAYVSGWAESPAGRGVVEVDGVPVDNGDGSFGMELTRPEGNGEWSATVTARFPDGSALSRVLVFDRDVQAELDGEALGSSGSARSDEALFGAEEQTAWGRIDGAKGGKVRLGERAEFDAPAGAVDGALSVGITRKMPEALPPLDAGMVNVTAPMNAGYRFSPPGQQFKKAVLIRLPYDPALLPEGVPAEQVQTFYFDKGEKQWKPLTRKQTLRASQQVESETTHFTFMINAVLVMPDHPGPASFDPTSIKDLKVGAPQTGIARIEPPAATNQGTARLGLELQVPAGRGSFSPPLALAYDSAGPNGWVGVGWDLSASSVQLDTRFGAPFHDGSERFVLDGEQLVPVGSGPCADGSSGERFAARVERAFRRVVHCAKGTGEDRFEVSGQDGVLQLYGVTPGARLADPADSRRIGQWMLERVVDPHGNLAAYRYGPDSRRTSGGTAFDAANREPFTQRYLKEILYSGKVARASAALPELGFLGAAQMGPYLVQLELERSGGSLLERPDIQISGRLGFKTVVRHRLGRVKVRLNTAEDDTVIREYRFTYEQGDFGKSRLLRVDQFGVGGVDAGALFHTHALEYQSVHDSGVSAFPEVVKYPFALGDDDAMTASTEWALGAHAYAGIGFTVDKQQGSVGARVGFNHRESTTQAMLMDVNGDGLPDRIRKTGAGLLVQLNDPNALQMSQVAPAGDPHAGLALRAVAGGLSLGNESGDSVNAALQATFASFSANVGLTRSWSN